MVGIKHYIQAYQDYQKGRIGDAGYLEFKLYSWGANPELLAQLQELEGHYPTIDLDPLSQLPPGTLGYEYAQHMQKYGIQPLAISPNLRQDARRNPFARRLLTVHDIFHVLLGFSTSYSGEAGVFAFTAAQGYSKMLTVLQPLGLVGLILISPANAKRTISDFCRGRALGKQANCLLTYRFEENWARPIDEVRAELGLSLGRGSGREVDHPSVEGQTQSAIAT